MGDSLGSKRPRIINLSESKKSNGHTIFVTGTPQSGKKTLLRMAPCDSEMLTIDCGRVIEHQVSRLTTPSKNTCLVFLYNYLTGRAPARELLDSTIQSIDCSHRHTLGEDLPRIFVVATHKSQHEIYLLQPSKWTESFHVIYIPTPIDCTNGQDVEKLITAIETYSEIDGLTWVHELSSDEPPASGQLPVTIHYRDNTEFKSFLFSSSIRDVVLCIKKDIHRMYPIAKPILYTVPVKSGIIRNNHAFVLAETDTRYLAQIPAPICVYVEYVCGICAHTADAQSVPAHDKECYKCFMRKGGSVYSLYYEPLLKLSRPANYIRSAYNRIKRRFGRKISPFFSGPFFLIFYPFVQDIAREVLKRQDIVNIQPALQYTGLLLYNTLGKTTRFNIHCHETKYIVVAVLLPETPLRMHIFGNKITAECKQLLDIIPPNLVNSDRTSVKNDDVGIIYIPVLSSCLKDPLCVPVLELGLEQLGGIYCRKLEDTYINVDIRTQVYPAQWESIHMSINKTVDPSPQDEFINLFSYGRFRQNVDILLNSLGFLFFFPLFFFS